MVGQISRKEIKTTANKCMLTEFYSNRPNAKSEIDRLNRFIMKPKMEYK